MTWLIDLVVYLAGTVTGGLAVTGYAYGKLRRLNRTIATDRKMDLSQYTAPVESPSQGAAGE